jgi:hypothetical protein
MKSLIALVVVIFAVIGMVGGVYLIFTHRWPDRALQAKFEGVAAKDVAEVKIQGADLKPSGEIDITDPAKIQLIIDAFRHALRTQQEYDDKTETIRFEFKDKRPEILSGFGRTTVDNYLGPDVAKALQPYLR